MWIYILDRSGWRIAKDPSGSRKASLGLLHGSSVNCRCLDGEAGQETTRRGGGGVDSEGEPPGRSIKDPLQSR